MRHITIARSLLMAAILVGAAWQAAQAAAPFAREVPSTYPTFDEGAGSLSLVVAELAATDILKAYDTAPLLTKTNPDGTTTVSLNLNPPPSWFKARVLQHVAGADIGDEFYAVAGSHWGPMKVGPAEPAKLMLLRSNGTALEMRRYAFWPVTRSKDGQYYLLIRSGPIPWLPCWAASLMQEIDDSQFAAGLAITREEYDSQRVAEHPAFYRVSADGVRPRYGIPVALLQQRLQDAPLVLADFSCRQPIPAP